MSTSDELLSETDEINRLLEQALADIIDVTERFEARKTIGQAKELLMAQRKLTEPEAYRWIQKTAMDRRTSMVTISGTIIEGLGATEKAG